MASLAVDPDVMFTAGSAVAAVGEDIVAALGSLTAGFGANTGQDAAGDMFGLAYQDAAKSLLKAAAAVINACRDNGAKIQLSASNYSRAEAASTLGGGSGVLPAPHDPQQFSAPGPPGTLGAGPPPPMLWCASPGFSETSEPGLILRAWRKEVCSGSEQEVSGRTA
ncbi:hypothetical protein [Mycobacterium ostraviense]|nr:hypothetical protein [Mycobacterium ostraviense]